MSLLFEANTQRRTHVSLVIYARQDTKGWMRSE